MAIPCRGLTHCLECGTQLSMSEFGLCKNCRELERRKEQEKQDRIKKEQERKINEIYKKFLADNNIVTSDGKVININEEPKQYVSLPLKTYEELLQKAYIAEYILNADTLDMKFIEYLKNRKVK